MSTAQVPPVPYSQRPEWADIKPIPPFDVSAISPICPIAYNDRFKDVMGYFRAILEKDERSERALQLTADVLEINSANYTAWYFRRKILDALSSDLRDELHFTETIAAENPKNYQLWYSLLQYTSLTSQLAFCEAMLQEDCKNYHAWAHRQWVCEAYKKWELELDFIDRLLLSDFRNNSAWNHRYFVITRTEQKITTEIARREIEFAIRYISKAPNNPSPWAYLIGFIKLGGGYAAFPEVQEYCRTAMGKYPVCAHCIALLVDILESEHKVNTEEVKELIVKLRDKVDPPHKRYWEYRLRKVPEKEKAEEKKEEVTSTKQGE